MESGVSDVGCHQEEKTSCLNGRSRIRIQSTHRKRFCNILDHLQTIFVEKFFTIQCLLFPQGVEIKLRGRDNVSKGHDSVTQHTHKLQKKSKVNDETFEE